MAPRSSRPSAVRLAALSGGVLLALVGGAGVAAAGPVQDPVPVGPDQYFSGTVNGQAGSAVITTDCAGPVSPVQTGHPLAGQYVEAVLGSAVTSDSGYTGSGTTALSVTLGRAGVSTAQVVGTLRSYFVRLALPTSLVVPCSGSGTVTFAPQTSVSADARAATVAVTFASPALSPS